MQKWKSIQKRYPLKRKPLPEKRNKKIQHIICTRKITATTNDLHPLEETKKVEGTTPCPKPPNSVFTGFM
jgi:hypothetical protein